jgi:hypothetical protein
MTKMLLCCAALLALGACATGGDLKGDLDSLVGQPVQKAIDRLGPPAAKSDEADGDRTYVWESNYDVQYSTSQPANSLGVRDPNDMAGDTSPGAASSNDAPTNYRCFVRITASSAGLIKATAWGGNGDGCAAYAARLR